MAHSQGSHGRHHGGEQQDQGRRQTGEYEDDNFPSASGPSGIGGRSGGRPSGSRGGGGRISGSDWREAQQGMYEESDYGGVGGRDDERRRYSQGGSHGGYGGYGYNFGGEGSSFPQPHRGSMSGEQQARYGRGGFDQQRGASTGDDDQQFDPDYHQWRSEQMRALDDDYRTWRKDRYKKFSDEFSTWRNDRQKNQAAQTGSASKGSGDDAAQGGNSNKNNK